MMCSPFTAKRVLLLSGESSGDQQGASLVKAVYEIDPSIEFFGMGGPHLRDAGMKIVVDSGPLAVVGLIEILWHIVPLFKAWRTIRRLIQQKSSSDNPIDALVLIDYPKFNLMMAKAAKKAGIPVLYYISPQIWAWHRRRIHQIKACVDKMLVVFPFEEPLYQQIGVPVAYVGHPLADSAHPSEDKVALREQWNLQQRFPVIGLLPGSRQGEVKRLLPIFLAAAEIIAQRYPDAVFLLPLARSLSHSDIALFIHKSPVEVIVVDQFYNAVSLCDVAIVASGTATLETALLGVPLVIAYKVSNLTYQLAKRVIKIPYIGLCNIVMGQLVAKELIQQQANPEQIVAEVCHILEDEVYNKNMRQQLAGVREKLGSGSASQKAARALCELLGWRSNF